MTNKVKIEAGLASILLVLGFLLGGMSFALVIMFLLVFCELDQNTKTNASKIITFAVGITLFSMIWNIIFSGSDIIIDFIESTVNLINSLVEDADLDVSKIVAVANYVLTYADRAVEFLITVTKFAFVIALFSGKPIFSNPVTNKINEYVNKAINYLNNGGVSSAAPQAAPQAPITPEK